MAIILSAGVSDLIFGMQWSRVIPGETAFGKTLELGRKIKAKYRIWYTYNGITSVGVSARPVGKIASRAAGIYCAAVLFAKQFASKENAIYIHSISDTLYAAIIVVEGLPYLECMIAPEKVAARIAALETETQVKFTFYGGCKSIPDVIPMSLGDLASVGGTGSTLVPFTDTRSIKTLSTITFVFIALIAINEFRKARQERIDEQEARVLAVDPINAYTESINRMLATAGFSGQDALKSFWGPVADRDVVVDGWLNRSMAFRPGAATEEWEMLPGSTEASLKEAIGQEVRLSTSTGKVFTAYRTIASPHFALVRTRLPENAKFVARMKEDQTALGMAGVKFSFQLPKLAGLPSGLTPTQIPPRITVAKGTFAAEGALGQMEDLLQNMGNNLAIEELVIKIAGATPAAQFSVKGTYYVKN